jgi:hypothetical protein
MKNQPLPMIFFSLLPRVGFIYIQDVHILVHSHFELASLFLVQFATRTVTQMISSVAIWCTSKVIGTKAAILF